MWRAMQAKAAAVTDLLAEAQETRRQWEALTEPTRRIAVAADLELRRRHPDADLDPLTSAEPSGGIPDRQESQPSEAAWGPQRDVLGQAALGLTPDTVNEAIPAQLHRIRENMRTAQARIDDLRDTRVPSEDPDEMGLGLAWDVLARRERDAILQPPRPQITPASEIIRRAQERTAAREPEPS